MSDKNVCTECLEQARLLGISGSKELKLIAEIAELKSKIEEWKFLALKWAPKAPNILDYTACECAFGEMNIKCALCETRDNQIQSLKSEIEELKAELLEVKAERKQALAASSEWALRAEKLKVELEHAHNKNSALHRAGEWIGLQSQLNATQLMVKELESEYLEQARLNGIGGERELKLMVESTR